MTPRSDGGRRREPAGIERASRTSGVPPPSRRKGPRRPPKPDIPESVEPDLPRQVYGEIRRHARNDRDVARAVTLAMDALASGDVDAAVDYLEWSKADAPRAASIRETLGIARYHAEDWNEALGELQAYRRFSGRTDQNHLIADCLRALERPLDMIAEAVEEMDEDDDGADRVAEGVIVWASALADDDDLDAARAVLQRALPEAAGGPTGPAPDEPELHQVRLWYVAGDLAERSGDHDVAETWFRRVAAIDEDLYDVGERLRRLA